MLTPLIYSPTEAQPFICSRCPFSGDPHRTVVLPIVSSKELKYPSLHKWFVVKLFSFVKPQTFENMVCKILFPKLLEFI